jgi:hypothetical protein
MMKVYIAQAGRDEGIMHWGIWSERPVWVHEPDCPVDWINPPPFLTLKEEEIRDLGFSELLPLGKKIMIAELELRRKR